MAQLPSIKQIKTEAFAAEQQKWIDVLLKPLNLFLTKVYDALNRRLTVNANLLGEIRQIETDGSFPLRLSWSLSARPVVVVVGDVKRKDGATPTVDAAVQVVWQFSQTGELQIDAVKGLTTTPPSAANRYYLTLLCLCG